MMNSIFKISTLLFLIGFCSVELKGQQIDKNKQLVYNLDELKTGEFLHDFMMIGPFPNQLPDGVKEYFHLDKTCLGFANDYLESAGGEKNAKPYIGQEIVYGNDKKLSWKIVHSTSDIVDLKKIFSPNDKVVAYVALWIDSDKEVEKLMGIGSNDGMKVSLNGEMLIKVHKPRTVTIDAEYLKLNLKKGKNLLLIKIEQSFGGWGFVLRPVDNKTAWKQVQKHIDVAMDSEFIVDGDVIRGTVGSNNIVGQLSGLPVAEVNFKSIAGSHSKTLNVPVGTKLALKKSDFPDDEYTITTTFKTDNSSYTSYAYMNTVVDVVKETRQWMYKDLPKAPESPMANYYKDFINTTQWLDQANKLWEHPYGYRRYLDGIKNAHKGTKKLINSKNPFDVVFPAPQDVKFGNSSVIVSSEWQIVDPNRTDDFIEVKLNDFWKKEFGTSPVYIQDHKKKKTIVLELSNSKKIWKLEGSYIIEITKEKVSIKAKSRQGLFYGISTLIQALEQNTTLLIGTINDHPAYPVRSVVLTKVKAVINDDFKTYIKQLSDLRYNEIYLPSNAYLHLDDPKRLKEIEEVFAYCKSHFIEPVAYFETFGAGTLTRVLDPCLDEGIFHKNEVWKVPGSGIIELDVPRIQDCQNTSIHIYTKAGKELERYTDYKVLSTEKPKILIQDQKLYHTELILNYDAVDFSGFPHPASCPSDPHGWELQENVILNTLTLLKPKKLHISQDEVGFMNKCSRCLARGLTNKEIMIDQITKVHKIIRKYDRDVEIYIWGDMFNDFQNAPKVDVEGSITGLPKDILVHDWNYIGVYHSDKMKTVNQMNFYLDRDYRTGGVVWFEPANILDVMLTGEKHKGKFLGIMHSAWAKFEHSLLPTAEANWSGKTILNKLEF